MKKIKVVEKGIIETNSSSSHSLTLSRENFIKPGDKEWDVNIKDRILYIPSCDSFGWEYFKFNSCQRKLQYLSGLFFYEGDISLSAQKNIKKLKALLCKVFDIDDVIFEWVEDYKKDGFKEDMEGRTEFDPAYTDFNPPTVDHESRDLIEEIIESEETLRSFLFSRDSWVFGGSDSAGEPYGFYKEEKQKTTNTTASIEFPGFGRVDFRVYYPGNISKYITNELNYIKGLGENGDGNLLKYLVYDIDKKVVYLMNNIEELDIKKIDQSKYMDYKAIISYKGDYYCIFTQAMEEFMALSSENITNWEKAVRSLYQPNERVEIPYKSTFKSVSDKFVRVIDSGLVKEDVDYKLFKIELKQDELDHIYE